MLKVSHNFFYKLKFSRNSISKLVYRTVSTKNPVITMQNKTVEPTKVYRYRNSNSGIYRFYKITKNIINIWNKIVLLNEFILT